MDELQHNLQNLPYEFDEGIRERAAIGLIVLATDQTIEHEYRLVFQLPGVALYQSRIRNDPQITPETLAAMEQKLTEATDVILPGLTLDVIAFGCTSASMIIGTERIADIIRSVRPKAKVTNPVSASLTAFASLGMGRIALLTPYRDDINQQLRYFFESQGIAVPAMGSFNEEDDNKAGRISPESISEAAKRLGKISAVDGVFVSCTNLRLMERVEEIENHLGIPVTSSNHAMAWHTLKLAGINEKQSGFGRLFQN